MEDASENNPSLPASPHVIQRLVAGRRGFLSFLESQVHSRAAAEEILQAALLRTLEKGGSIEEPENAVAWFYRVLRNAVTDYYRKRAAEVRTLETEANDPGLATELEFYDAVCQCVRTILPTLKSEYSEIVRRIDLEEQPLAAVASDLQISTNNAAVRLHRARHALKRQLERSCGACATHGCLDCTCGKS